MIIFRKSFSYSFILFGTLLLNSSSIQAHDGVDGASFLEILKSRRSGRSYDAHRSLSSEQIQQLIEAGQWAPSCYGDEPWRFIICSRQTHPDAYKKVLDSLVEFNQNWAQHAPVLLVVVARTQFKNNEKPNRWAPYDTGAAAQNILLQARVMGLMGHEMGGFDEKKIKKAFQIKGPYEVMAVMALGYEQENAPDAQEPRHRQPQEKIAKEGAWVGE